VMSYGEGKGAEHEGWNHGQTKTSPLQC